MVQDALLSCPTFCLSSNGRCRNHLRLRQKSSSLPEQPSHLQSKRPIKEQRPTMSFSHRLRRGNRRPELLNNGPAKFGKRRIPPSLVFSCRYWAIGTKMDYSYARAAWSRFDCQPKGAALARHALSTLCLV